MVLPMQFCFLSCIILSICHGFLLSNKTGISSVGTHGLTDSHYLILTDELGIQKQLIAQMETFVLQLQNELKTVKDLKSGNSATQSLAFEKLKNESFIQSRVVAELKNETSEFREKSARLQNSYDILQKKYDTLQNENNVFKGQITDLRNSSVMMNQKLNSFTHSVDVSSIQNVTAIQHNIDSLTSEMNNINSRLNSLSSISTSRSQDILTLLNITNAVDSRSQSFQNRTKKRIDSLELNYGLVSNDIKTVKGKVQEMNEPVALTSCTVSETSYKDGQIIKFPATKTSVGINNLAAFHSTGKLTCGKSGLYLFSVFIGYHGHSTADFVMYKNSQDISYVMIVDRVNSGNLFSGSGTVVVQMNVGDILFAKAYRNDMKVAGYYSCFTVLKIN